MHTCWAFIDPCNLCGSSWPGIPSYPLTLYVSSSSQNRSVSRIPFGCRTRCGGALIMSGMPSSSTVHHIMIEWTWRCTPRSSLSQYGDALGGHNRGSVVIHLEGIILQDGRYAPRAWSCEYRDTLGSHNGVELRIHLESVIEEVRRWTPRAWPSETGDALGGHDGASLEIDLEAITVRVWRYTQR